MNLIHQKQLFLIIFSIEYVFFHIFIEFLLELNFGKPNENESFIESIYKRIESSTFGLFWLLFGNFSDSTSINYSLTIELNNPLN